MVLVRSLFECQREFGPDFEPLTVVYVDTLTAEFEFDVFDKRLWLKWSGTLVLLLNNEDIRHMVSGAWFTSRRPFGDFLGNGDGDGGPAPFLQEAFADVGGARLRAGARLGASLYFHLLGCLRLSHRAQTPINEFLVHAAEYLRIDFPAPSTRPQRLSLALAVNKESLDKCVL